MTFGIYISGALQAALGCSDHGRGSNALKEDDPTADRASVRASEATDQLREALLEIEWLSRRNVSRETLKRINEVARTALRSDDAPQPADVAPERRAVSLMKLSHLR